MSIIKIWRLIKALKGKSYDKIVDAILPLLFENKVIGRFLGQYKTVIGFILLVLYAALEHAQIIWPQYTWLPQTLLVVGLILEALGIAHRGSKERRAG